ncbi:hypothetical protein [Burkholderia ambifaria]|uniref:hypothetical protein n=1 Tax=Burkholderia ambifaria TaxID=152480 RepID=UPI00158A4D04|nr:hypothetical protein [Burkholderia ambifaria]
MLDQGYSHMEASRSVDVGETVLSLGAATSDGASGRRAAGQGNHAGQRRIQELEARIERLEREKAILKKAAALLMSEGTERAKQLIRSAQANRSN